MSFEAELQAAALAGLKADPVIAAQANGAFLERPARASVPYLVLGEMLSADWSVKGLRGREARLIVQVYDTGESWARTMMLQSAAGAAMDALPRAISAWALGAVTLLRSRTMRDGTTGWRGTIEYRVRAMEN